ncbi:MAG: hypothetical protein IPF99_42420 [Deltaproteobacteria bacterium]|nr:hypothetical protein [Deltaproteobacteria bacterium]
MHPSSRWLTAGVLISLSLGCSARGGGGPITSFDSGAEGDSTAPVDSATPDDTLPPLDQPVAPTDDGVAPTDNGKVPVDLGVPPVDVGVPPTDLGQPVDVGTPPMCGDARCNGAENCMTCPTDCGACSPTCGDRTCASTENCTTCPTDCGACPAVCGDGACASTESCSTCSRDCGACAPVCGDGTCNGAETCSSCSSDCGACPANCAAVGSCGACTSNPACGWCTLDGACQRGTASGPSVTSSCSVFGGWVRSATACAVDSGVRDTGTPDTGSSTSLTHVCNGTEDAEGPNSECNWILAQTYTCTPSSVVTLGCTGGADAGSCVGRVGSCTGDPMMRVCPGSSAQCSNATRVPSLTLMGYSEDDACGTCPLARFTCPSSGALTVYARRYYADRPAACVIGRL